MPLAIFNFRSRIIALNLVIKPHYFNRLVWPILENQLRTLFEEGFMSDSKPRWKHDEIRLLRLRLGWTQADLARRLSCDLQLVESLEIGSKVAAIEVVHKLELIAHQADLCGEEIQNRPVAENMCDQEQLGQVELNKIIKKL